MPTRPVLLALALVISCHGGGATRGVDPTGGSSGALSSSGGTSSTGEPGSTASATTGDASTGTTGTSGTVTTGIATTTGTTGGVLPCPAGVTCVDSYPFTDQRDTGREPPSKFDTYSCEPDADESGPEVIYRVSVPEDGFLSAAVYDGDGVDIDLHILDALDANACLTRGDRQVRADVAAGEYWVIADTYASGGVPQAGAFRIDIGFIVPSRGPCALEVGEMARVGDGGVHLAMPATGPIVEEAHLVTQDEPAPYPMTATDELAAHYEHSQAVTGLVMVRTEVWAPLEGGSFYGAGIGDPALFPALHEGWYVNMYWTAAARPPRGTRMILREPGGNRAVVVAAGYETGPGDLAHIGGTPEESHFYLGTHHLDTLQLGIATDQTLPHGPRVCE